MSKEDTRIEKVFRGTIIHSLGWDSGLPDGGFQILHNALLGVNNKGRIAFVGDAAHENDLAETFHFNKNQVIDLGKRFLIPGFVDTHIHAPQYAFAGTGNDLQLLDWLNRYTFPTESKFQDTEFARRVYTKAVQRSLFSGTTTACYFATIHLPPTLTLVDVIGKLGQRALVGKVCMDRNSPDFYRETTEGSIKATQQFVDHVLQINNPLIKPVITPRFVPTCTGELMRGIADIAHHHNLPIQSHVSENKGEVAWVKELHPDVSSYTEVYDKYGLLTPQTLLAHAIYLSDHELNLFKEREAGICHCPVSNFSLNSGILDARRVLDAQVKLGLGTDVSGGYSSSILEVIRQSVTASKSIQMQHPESSKYKVLTFKEAFSLATLGGSQVLNLQDKIGNFVPGKDFDALIINPVAEGSPFDVFEIDSFEDIFQKFVFLGDDRNIEEIFVAGKTIFHPDSIEALHRKKRKADTEVTASPTVSRAKPAKVATEEQQSSSLGYLLYPLAIIGVTAFVGLRLFLNRRI